MENEIKELIEKWKNRREGYMSEAAYEILEDLKSLLELENGKYTEINENLRRY